MSRKPNIYYTLAMFQGSKTPQNGTKKRLKNELETRALKIRRFSALGGPRQCPGAPRRGPFYAKTAFFLGSEISMLFRINNRSIWEGLAVGADTPEPSDPEGI